MKSTLLTAAIVFFLTSPVSLLAVEVMPVDVDSITQQTVAETRPDADMTVTESTEQQAVAGMLSEIAVTTAGSVEPQVLSEIPADVAAPATPGQPCPMHGMGKMRKGMMGQGGKGPGCMKQGCGHGGKGQQDRHQQVVRRLDMIEARIAKIEVMLESLMQR